MDEYLGKLARDIVTGLEGIIVSKGEYLNGCVRYCVQPVCEPGASTTPDREWFDVHEIEIVGPGVTDKLPRSYARESVGSDQAPSADTLVVTGGPTDCDPPDR